MKKISFLLLFFVLLVSCKNEGTYRPSMFRDGYKDGIYCAAVGYINPKTGTESNYTLKVKIEDNELVTIYWSNGGWLDDSHFSPPDITSGYADFKSDKGNYSVLITGEGGDCYTDSYVPPPPSKRKRIFFNRDDDKEEQEEADYWEEEQEQEDYWEEEDW
jgi:hypothetical protein